MPHHQCPACNRSQRGPLHFWVISWPLIFLYCSMFNKLLKIMVAGNEKLWCPLRGIVWTDIWRFLILWGKESNVFMFLQVILQQVLYCPEMMFKVSIASGSLCHITLQLPPNCFWITFPLARSGNPHFILHCTMYSALTPLITMLMSEWKMIKHKLNSNHMFSVIYLFCFLTQVNNFLISPVQICISSSRFASQTPESRHLACVQTAEPELQLIQSDSAHCR